MKGLDQQQAQLAEELLFAEKKKSSFVKRLYFGQWDAEQILPYPNLEGEEKTVVEDFVGKVRALAKELVDPVWIDRHASIPENVIRALSHLGVMGMTVPKEYGGLGMSYRAYCRVTEELAGRCCSTALFVNVHQSIGMKAILLFGTPEQRSRWLPPLAKGKEIAAFSLTEPNAGSDASGIETRAQFDPEKNVYRIDGVKQWTTHGSIAKVLTVMAKTEVETAKGKEEKVTAFLVTPEMAGFTVLASSLEKVGMRGTQTANLAFRGMQVPAANVLGPVGGGLKVCLTVLDYGRVTFGASCTGVAKILLAAATEHARTRVQFKRPLAAFELVKDKIANMAALTYAMEATTYLTAGLIDAGVEDFMLEAAVLKVFASDALWTMIYETMQIFGGRSFFTDQPFERWMRDARLNMIGEGSNEVLRVFIAAIGMRDVGVDLKVWMGAVHHPFSQCSTLQEGTKRLLGRLFRPEVPIQSPLLQKEAKALSRAIRQLGIAVVRVLGRYREEVVEHQIDLDRVTTSVMAIYTTTAVLSKLDSELKEGKASSQNIAAAKLFCRQSMCRVRRSLDMLFAPIDKQIVQTADLFTSQN